MRYTAQTIVESLQRLQENIAQLSSANNTLHPIDLDIALEELRAIYSQLLEMRRQSHAPTTNLASATQAVENETEEPQAEELSQPSPVQTEPIQAPTQPLPIEKPSTPAEESPAEAEHRDAPADMQPAEPTFAEEENIMPTLGEVEQAEGKSSDDLVFEQNLDEKPNTPAHDEPREHANQPLQPLANSNAATQTEPASANAQPTEQAPEPTGDTNRESAAAAATHAPSNQPTLWDMLDQPTPQATPSHTVNAPSEPSPATTPADNGSLRSMLGNAGITHTLGESLVRPVMNTAGSIKHRVSDLRTAININDKFSFMNELFHDNMKAYNDFIMRLNAIATREEALNYVNQTAEQNNWNSDSATVKTFFSIFDRKF